MHGKDNHPIHVQIKGRRIKSNNIKNKELIFFLFIFLIKKNKKKKKNYLLVILDAA